jgi:hypothetical protein
VHRDDGDGRAPLGFLPTVRVGGLADPVIEVRRVDRSLVYTRRIRGTTFTPPVFEAAAHVVRVGDPARDFWMERVVMESDWGSGSLDFEFDD